MNESSRYYEWDLFDIPLTLLLSSFFLMYAVGLYALFMTYYRLNILTL